MYGAPFTDDTAIAADPPPQDAGTPPADQAQQQQQAAPTDQPPPTNTAPEAPPVIEVPADIAELREQDGPRHLFTPQKTYAESIPDTMFDALVEVPEQTRVAVLQELREMAADTGLSLRDVDAIRQRAAYVRAHAPSAAEQKQEAINALRDAFGNVDNPLRDIRALTARDPRVGRLIDSMGLGNDAQTLVMLAYAARSQRLAGRLK